MILKQIIKLQDNSNEESLFDSFNDYLLYLEENFLKIIRSSLNNKIASIQFFVDDFLLIDDYTLRVRGIPEVFLNTLTDVNQNIIKISQLLFLPQNEKRDKELQQLLSTLDNLSLEYIFKKGTPFNNNNDPVPVDKVDHINQNLFRINIPLVYKRNKIIDKFNFTVLYDE